MILAWLSGIPFTMYPHFLANLLAVSPPSTPAKKSFRLYPSGKGKSTFTLELNAIKLHYTHHVKIDLNEKLDPKQKTFQIFNIDAQRFRKTKNENPQTWEIRVTS